ncbi:hypothetical protein FF1_025092 [Malus domestica]
MMIKQNCFLCLQCIEVSQCPNLTDLTWLIFAPNLCHLRMGGVGNVVQELNPFGKLTVLILSLLPRQSSIHDSPLPFPYLKEIKVTASPTLRKLPLNSTSAEGSNITLRSPLSAKCRRMLQSSFKWQLLQRWTFFSEDFGILYKLKAKEAHMNCHH